MPALFTAQMQTRDFGDSGPCRPPPWVFCILSLPRLTAALEVASNELSPRPTHFLRLTPSDALSNHLSDLAVPPPSCPVPCSDL